MPSLKDLRNRIASVKSTQKITKAMQMVAVSKLRRAQSAVEAARPYAEQVEAVLTNLAGAATDGQGPRLLVGSGSDQVHLLARLHGRARAVRRLQHRDRAPRARKGQCARRARARRSRSCASARRAMTSFAAPMRGRFWS